MQKFIDEIQWIKPESSVKNRNGGYQQTHMPLSYKPNCINESIMVYRKYALFYWTKTLRCMTKLLQTMEFLNHQTVGISPLLPIRVTLPFFQKNCVEEF